MPLPLHPAACPTNPPDPKALPAPGALADAPALLDLWPRLQRYARFLARHRGAQHERDDLIGAGVVGLLEAWHRHRGVAVPDRKRLAWHRARGAMLDWLRRQDPHGRRVGRRGDRDEAKGSTGREVAAATGEHWALGGGTMLGDRSREAGGPTWASSWIRPDALEHAIDGLPTRTRRVLAVLYGDGASYREAARACGLSRSRIAQIHGEALVSLRGVLQVDAPGGSCSTADVP